MSLTLFDSRPKCENCRRPYSGPTWEVIDERGLLAAPLGPLRPTLDVCSECAHDFRRKRQRVSAR